MNIDAPSRKTKVVKGKRIRSTLPSLLIRHVLVQTRARTSMSAKITEILQVQETVTGL